ncbi:hypothetical protein ABKN59_001730 [Abortiporus biennis]
MPTNLVSPLVYFGTVKGQSTQHSERCGCLPSSVKSVCHDGDCTKASIPVKKAKAMDPYSKHPIHFESFEAILAAHRFLPVQFVHTPPNASLFDKYIKPALQFHRLYIIKDRNMDTTSWEELPPMSNGIVSMVRFHSHKVSEMLAEEKPKAFCDVLFMSPGTGTLVPHYYGAHMFIVDNYPNSYGILLEVISGPTLNEIPVYRWPEDRQISLVRHLRHCLKVLLYAGIDQGDFHPGHIMLPHGENYDPDKDGFVFLDFAFAAPRLGDEQADGIAAEMVGDSRGKLLETLVFGLGINLYSIQDSGEWPHLDLEEI